MRHLACLTVLFAALFLASGCGLLPEEKQSPFTAAEIDQLLMDNPAIRDAMQLAAMNCRSLSRKQSDRIILGARDDKVRALGWDLDRYNYVLSRCREILGHRHLKARVAGLEATARTAMQAGRDELLRELAHWSGKLRDVEKHIFTEMPVTERVLLDERMDALLADLADDAPIIQPYTPQ